MIKPNIPQHAMRLMITSLLLIIACINIQAQGGFQRAIGAEGYEKGSALRQLPDGGFIIAGETDKSFGLQESDMLMMRADKDGNLLWTQTYGGPEREVINDVLQTADFNFIAIAEKYQPNKTEGEFLTVLKTDAAGNLMWKKSFDEGGNETEGFSMAATPDGNYIITGIVKNMNIVSDAFFTMRSANQSLFLLKIDGNGNKIWSKKLASSSGDIATTGVSIIVARDGSYIVTGNITKKGTADNKIEKPLESIGNSEERNMLLAKINPDGSLAWSKEYVASRITAGFSVIEKTEGGFFAVGITTIGNTDNLNIYAMSMNSNGDVEWAKTLGGNDFESVSDALQTRDGGFVVAGMTESFGHGFQDALLFKLNNNGFLLWAKAIGGKSMEYGTKLALVNDNIILAGEVSSLPGESFDVMLVRTDENGNSGCISMDISLDVRDFNPLVKRMETAANVEIEKGIVPPNFKKADINNINGQVRQMRVKNVCN